MERIGHRGAMGYEPENTLRSFAKALRIGVDIIEFDVYVLKDKEVVVFHDDTLERTTNGTGYLLDKTYEELLTLDAGKGEKIPKLQEVLDLIDQQAVSNIELKGPGSAGPVADIIQDYVTNKDWKYDNFLVSSFDYGQLRQFKILRPEVKIGALIEDVLPQNAAFATALGASFVGPELTSVTAPFVQDIHERGMRCFVYTVNEKEAIERMQKIGVDGVFSNYPDRIRRSI